MKNIMILGVARAGKTTLARLIKQKYPNYNIIDGDCIRMTFEEIMPEANINRFNGLGMAEKFPKFCIRLFDSQIEYQKNYFNYIFESCGIMPIHIKNYFNTDNTEIFFLWYPKLTVEETVNNYKKYADKDDYMIKKTDEEILDRAIKWTQKSKELEKECHLYGMNFIDVSYNRDEIFKKIIKDFYND